MIQRTLLIEKPVEAVFDFLYNPQNHTRFIPGMVEFSPRRGESALTEGTEIAGLRKLLWGKVRIPYTITRSIPGKELAMRGKMGFLPFEDGYLLSPNGGGTRIDFWLKFPVQGWMKILHPFLWLVGIAHAAETLAKLKKALRD